MLVTWILHTKPLGSESIILASLNINLVDCYRVGPEAQFSVIADADQDSTGEQCAEHRPPADRVNPISVWP